NQSNVPLQSGDVPNGQIVLGDPWADVNKHFDGQDDKKWKECQNGECGNFEELRKLKEENPNLSTLLSVGGWSCTHKFSDLAADPEARETFAQSAVDIIHTYGFDGIDVDWEYPVGGGLEGNDVSDADKHNMTLLLKDIREALDEAGEEDGEHYLLTIAT